MCGRVIVDYDEMMPVAGGTELATWLTDRPTGAVSSWNIAPTQAIPVAYTHARSGARRFELAHWSLVPVWARDMKLKYPTFNARSEDVTEKASFKAAVRKQRCAIPVTGFYEWTGPKTARTPHAIVGPEPVLALAGLYSWWHEPGASDDAGWHLTATILTRESAGVMAPLHDRMPVFLADDLVPEWLDPETPGDQSLVDAVSAAAVPLAARLREWPVRPLRGDGPQLLEPA